ncbi:MAG: hypothetical protein JWQ43_2109 [Glaciihabitans sp.]|nr:hypothetical protein [Glaciihabitans sp.]
MALLSETPTPSTTPAAQHPPRRGPGRAAAPIVVGLLALAISLYRIDVPSIWYDESATIISSTRSWAQLGQMIGQVDAVHALYYALMHGVFDVFGYSPVTLRVPSSIATAGAAALTVVLGRQLGRPRFALVAGLVFCLLPRVTWMGGEGRSYAFTALLAVALTVVFVHALRVSASSASTSTSTSTGKRWWLVYAALVILSCLMFIYLALVVVAHAATMLWWLLSRDPACRDLRVLQLRRWLISTAAATALIVPFALLVMSESKQLHWLKPLGELTPRQVLREQWFYSSTPYAVVGCTLLLLGVVALLLRRRDSPLAAPMLVPALLLPTVALLVVTGVYLPIYTPRYLTMCLPFVALVMAAAIDAIASAAGIGAAAAASRLPTAGTVSSRLASYVPSVVAALLVGVLVVLAVPQINEQRQPLSKESTSWNQVANLIGEQRAAFPAGTTTAVIYAGVQYHPIATARVIAYSYPEAFRGTIDVTIDKPAAETGALWETRYSLEETLGRLDSADVVYLISSNARDVRDETAETLAEVGWSVDGAWDFSKVHVVRYARS